MFHKNILKCHTCWNLVLILQLIMNVANSNNQRKNENNNNNNQNNNNNVNERVEVLLNEYENMVTATGMSPGRSLFTDDDFEVMISCVNKFGRFSFRTLRSIGKHGKKILMGKKATWITNWFSQSFISKHLNKSLSRSLLKLRNYKKHFDTIPESCNS